MKRRHNRKMKTAVLSLALLVLLTLTACSNADGKPEVEEVDLSAVGRQVEAFGRVSVSEEMSVSLDVPARVDTVWVKDGQQVMAGEPVLLLDLTDYHHQAAELKAELAVVQAELRAQSAELGQETARLAQDLNFAEEELALARQDLQARLALQEAGAISQEEADRFRREAASREKRVMDLSLQMDRQAGAQEMNIRRERAAALEGRLQGLEEQLEQPLLEEASIISPYDRGAVIDLELKNGDRVEPGQRLFRFINLDALVVEADVLEEFIRDVHLGAAVTLVPAADRTRSYEGTVTAIADAAFVVNNETVVPVTISLKNADDFLRPNFNVDVFIEIP
ncbi:MAG: efflux RND transporter periplasmic adaptor subunit [Bacillota bacterium]|nr:efflux RND transporter periplasmic adaptor subunit [Bacillota bacterium]MDW7676701.1 efflux RND transporter periplasmic adaptor subunit [Bacillota bacterium]